MAINEPLFLWTGLFSPAEEALEQWDQGGSPSALRLQSTWLVLRSTSKSEKSSLPASVVSKRNDEKAFGFAILEVWGIGENFKRFREKDWRFLRNWRREKYKRERRKSKSTLICPLCRHHCLFPQGASDHVHRDLAASKVVFGGLFTGFETTEISSH